MKKTGFQLKLGVRLSALRDPQRKGDKRKIEEDWYQIIQVFTSAYKTSTGASQCCALRDLIWEYICRKKKLKETLESKTSQSEQLVSEVYNIENKVKKDTRGKRDG